MHTHTHTRGDTHTDGIGRRSVESAVFQVVVGVPGWWAGPGLLQFSLCDVITQLEQQPGVGCVWGGLGEGGRGGQRGDIRGLVLYFVCWYYFFDSG